MVSVETDKGCHECKLYVSASVSWLKFERERERSRERKRFFFLLSEIKRNKKMSEMFCQKILS